MERAIAMLAGLDHAACDCNKFRLFTEIRRFFLGDPVSTGRRGEAYFWWRSGTQPGAYNFSPEQSLMTATVLAPELDTSREFDLF